MPEAPAANAATGPGAVGEPALDLSRSIRLLRGFATEQSDPDAFYTMLAADTVALVTRHGPLEAKTVLDVGGGSGYFADAFAAAGALPVSLDLDRYELVARHARNPAVAGDGCRLPFASAAFDVCHSSNVIEHVRSPHAFFDEMIRVVRPGGTVFLAFTNWWSPFGGHETSPWHWLGGERAARRYTRRYGRDPKNRFGSSLFKLHIGEVLSWARGCPDVSVEAAYPRYYPHWAWKVTALPVVREVVTWNLVVVMRRTAGTA